MDRRHLLKASMASALGAALPIVRTRAATPIELPFYYPVAVGGPIAKIIDGYAAAFHKANPGISIHPIYTGTYQDTTAKALTALQGRRAPAHRSWRSLLATDMFTLIDEGMLVPFDDLARAATTRPGSTASIRRSSRTARPAARPGASRSSARRRCSTGTRRRSRRRAWTRTRPPADVGGDGRIRQEADRATIRRQRHRSGACRSRPRASPTGCSRGWRSRTAST